MSEPKKKKLRGAEGELLRALQISPDDVQANDQGYITDHQRETLITREHKQFAPLYVPTLIGFFVFLFMLMLSTFAPIAPEDMEAFLFLTGSAGLISGVLGAFLAYNWWVVRNELKADDVQTVQGIAVVTLDNTHNMGKLEINGVELKASPDILRRIRHLEPYTVHYLPDSKIVLSMAHIDDEANIRRDDSAATSRLQETPAVDSDTVQAYDEDNATSQRTQSS